MLFLRSCLCAVGRGVERSARGCEASALRSRALRRTAALAAPVCCLSSAWLSCTIYTCVSSRHIPSVLVQLSRQHVVSMPYPAAGSRQHACYRERSCWPELRVCLHASSHLQPCSQPLRQLGHAAALQGLLPLCILALSGGDLLTLCCRALRLQRLQGGLPTQNNVS